MNCRIIALAPFRKDAKRLLKKYASLKSELAALQTLLQENPRYGKLIQENTYKIRLAVKSKGRGKSGGLRVVTHVVEVELTVEQDDSEQDVTVFLLAIYDKSEMENLPDSDLAWLISEASAEEFED